MGLDVSLMRTFHVSYDNCKTWEEKVETVYDNNITHNLNKPSVKLVQLIVKVNHYPPLSQTATLYTSLFLLHFFNDLIAQFHQFQRVILEC